MIDRWLQQKRITVIVEHYLNSNYKHGIDESIKLIVWIANLIKISISILLKYVINMLQISKSSKMHIYEITILQF